MQNIPHTYDFDKRQVSDELEILNRHFKTAQKEKYSNAIIHFLYDKARKRERNTKLSKHAIKRVETFMRTRLQKQYGPYANVWLEPTRSKGIGAGYNIDQIYTTNYGRLYSSHISHANGILITTHAIERFEQRYTQHDLLNQFVKKQLNITSTALDRLLMLLNYIQGYYLDTQPDSTTNQDEQESGTYYIWCWPQHTQHIFSGGIFVLQRIESLFLVKTFLPELAAKNILPLNQWKREPNPYDFENMKTWLLSLCCTQFNLHH